MKYLLAFIVDERTAWDDLPPEEKKAAMDRWSAFDAEATEKGVLIACEPLEPSPATTTVEVRAGGDRIVTDGPFVETKEQLGGFCLLECENLDEALEWAHQVPLGAGAIEVRPVMDLSQFGYESRTVSPAKAPA